MKYLHENEYLSEEYNHEDDYDYEGYYADLRCDEQREREAFKNFNC